MQTIRTTRPGATLLFGVALALSPLAVQAQDRSSAVDANGTPVGTAENGAVGGPQIVGTDGMIRYGSAEEMWKDISSNWDFFGEKAVGRWGDVDPRKLEASGGDRAKLLALITQGYGISEEEAEREITAWMTSVGDDT